MTELYNALVYEAAWQHFLTMKRQWRAMRRNTKYRKMYLIKLAQLVDKGAAPKDEFTAKACRLLLKEKAQLAGFDVE